MNKLLPKRVKAGNIIRIVPFGSKIESDEVSLDFKPSTDSEYWQEVGDCMTFGYKRQTEDDAVKKFDRKLKRWNEDKETSVKSRSIEFQTAHVNEAFWQIAYDVEEPMTEGQEVTPFTRDSAGIKCWVQILKLDASGNMLMEIEVAGELKAENWDENDKAVRPKLTLDIEQSPLQTLKPGAGVGFSAA